MADHVRAAPDDGDDLVDALGRASFVVMARLSAAAAAHDLSLTQLRLLGILRDRTPRMAELAEHLGLDRSSVSGLVDRAVKRGLVRRDPSPDDGRVVRVGLTARGHRLAEAGAVEVAGLLAPLTVDLTATERRRLAELLDRLGR